MLVGPSFKTAPAENPSKFDVDGMKHAVFRLSSLPDVSHPLQADIPARTEAERALRLENGIPIGAALVRSDGVVIGVGRNRRVQDGSATKHGEVRLPAAFPFLCEEEDVVEFEGLQRLLLPGRRRVRDTGGRSERQSEAELTLALPQTDCLECIGRLPAKVYADCTMFSTLSPCSMCTGAMILFGIKRCVIGENDTFTGSFVLLFDSRSRSTC